MIRFSARIGLTAIALCVGLLLLPALSANAASTGPLKIVYDAHLLDSSGNAITSAHSVRFSWWTSADFVSGDTTATGAINTGASTYANWQEVHTVTPNSDGYFSVELGSGTALPDLSSYTSSQLQSLHLQVEVKVSSAADTSYELLDQNSSSDTADRSPIDTVPFALNADRLDQRDTGTASGSIPVLQSGGLLGLGLIPSGTNRDEFTLDADSSASGPITLQFGTSLAKTLTYDQANSRFNFNDDVRIQGNLTVTGSVTVGDFDAGTGTGAGTLRWTGTSFEGYDGTNWKDLTVGGSTFVGVSTLTSTGSFSTGSLVGYRAANNICANEYAGSHMCQIDEVITTIETNISSFSGVSNAWVAEGAPGYTSDSNDCKGWTSGSGAHLGAWWEFSTTGGGKGYLTNCATSQPIACCR